MDQTGVNRSFTVPVIFLLAGVLLGGLALMWLTVGGGPIMDEDATVAEAEPVGLWLPATAGVLAVASLGWGLRKLREPKHEAR